MNTRKIKTKIRKLLSLHLPNLKQQQQLILANNKLVGVDVGAANGLQPHWNINLPEIAELYLFEPGETEFNKVSEIYSQYPNIKVFPYALSGTNGPRTLYLTNQPTGSSLLPINKPYVIEQGLEHYFYPCREIAIETKTLENVLNQNQVHRVDMIKLDTQGTEFEIMKGMGQERLNSLLSVELELNITDANIGNPSFANVDDYMKDLGFELFEIRTNRNYKAINQDVNYYQHKLMHVYDNPPCVAARIREFDLVYFKRPSILLDSKDKDGIRKLIFIYCVYHFFADAYALVAQAEKLGVFTQSESKIIYQAIINWNKRHRRFYHRNLWPFNLLRKILRILRLGPQKRWAQYMWVDYPNF
ncbi:MAG: methyltransferase, FkbM family [Gammaproteobacteria bacterium]|jgi:FkbM family methyltransferase|nr:methyltransferase, FkbM family [Gammaproteobacteria bacterium]